MNDEQMQSLLDLWFEDADPTPPDTRQTAAEVMAEVPEVRQRGRWWPLPAWHRRTQTRTGTDPDRRSYDPITATGRHTPTLDWRTHTMISPIKAITAGALVFAIGGVLLIAQPVDRLGGGVPGAEQEADLLPPLKVTATFQRMDCDSSAGSSEGSFEEDGLVDRYRGAYCTVYNEWSDPRLQGTETYLNNGVEYMDGSELYVAHYVHDIVTDDGAWRMRPHFRFHSADDAAATPSSAMGAFSATWILDGEGAYEGLSAVLGKDGSKIAGYIVSTEMLPPAPERAAVQ